jgi:hypothetical protein
VFPDFVEAVRQVWLKGEDVDVAFLENTHKVPALFEHQICLTGFTDGEAPWTIIREFNSNYQQPPLAKVS